MFVGVGSLIYVVLTMFIGVYYARKVDTVKGFASANRGLPLYIVIATVFATWFGSESILGIPGAYANYGVLGMMSDPIGACLCLIIIGTLLGKKFYRLNVTTLVDFLRIRYGKKIEIILGISVSSSYLGWIAAQFIAFGAVLNFMFPNILTREYWIIMGAVITLVTTYKGGLMTVAVNDFVQMIMIVCGLLFTLFYVSEETGGVVEILKYGSEQPSFSLSYNEQYPNLWSVVTVVLAMILGTIPQQDTYQRIISAKDEDTAVSGAVLGGIFYFLITLIPIIIVIAADQLKFTMPESLGDEHKELLIIGFVMAKTPEFIQILFFGALLAAILSTISGTTLAASVVFSENVIGAFFPQGKTLLSFRLSLVFYVLAVLAIAMTTNNSIHGLVESSGKVTMVMAFCPLIFGLFWEKPSGFAALISIILSTSTWLILEFREIPFLVFDLAIPAALFGLFISLFSMIILSYVFPRSPSEPLYI